LPVTIRLLDPPLHEFLPNLPDLASVVERARIEEADDLPRLERLPKRTEEISEENPMQGLKEGDDYTVGTMIVLPRACFVANRIAEHADFFSFGTNDLTQTALDFSRDDVASRVRARLHGAQDHRPLAIRDDRQAAGRLARAAGRVGGPRAHPGLKLGICGEHGGDPESIEFFHTAGLDYVSCSTYRVPIARVAAALAAIQHAD
jgi:pyruvate,orthophosphate dikinase